MLVTKKEDILRGLHRLGLITEVSKTKVKEWERIHVHQLIRERTKENLPVQRYVCKISIQNGVLYSYTFKGLPDYYCYAIKLMLEKAVILNHINYLTLGVQAYNETVHLKEEAEKVKLDKKMSPGNRNKIYHKMMTKFYWEKQKRFTSLFTERYYGGVAPKGNTRYDLQPS